MEFVDFYTLLGASFGKSSTWLLITNTFFGALTNVEVAFALFHQCEALLIATNNLSFPIGVIPKIIHHGSLSIPEIFTFLKKVQTDLPQYADQILRGNMPATIENKI